MRWSLLVEGLVSWPCFVLSHHLPVPVLLSGSPGFGRISATCLPSNTSLPLVIASFSIWWSVCSRFYRREFWHHHGSYLSWAMDWAVGDLIAARWHRGGGRSEKVYKILWRFAISKFANISVTIRVTFNREIIILKELNNWRHQE